jgi:hypothetical protein
MKASRNDNVCPFVRAICPHISIREPADGFQQSLIHMLCDRTSNNIHSFYFLTLSNNDIKDTNLRCASESSAIPEMRQIW